MRAIVFHNAFDARLEERPAPKAVADRVVVDLAAVGICGTDVEIFHGTFPCQPGVIMGHEGAGVIAAVGPDVERFRIGDRVIFDAGWACGRCRLCTSDRPAQCTNRVMLGSNADGAFAEQVSVPAKVLHRLPNEVSFEEAQSALTIAAAIRGLHAAKITLGERAIIFGPGHAGLIFVQLLKLAGAINVTIVGTREQRLSIARELGADTCINLAGEDLAQRAAEITDGDGFDLAVEASGSPIALSQAMSVVRTGGTVLMFGVPHQPVADFRSFDIYRKELRIIGTRGSAGGQELALAYMAAKRIEIDRLVTHRFTLEQTIDALKAIGDRSASVLRAIVKLH